jgi:hypothetical protein
MGTLHAACDAEKTEGILVNNVVMHLHSVLLVVESFFHTLKTELIYHRKCNARLEAGEKVFEYIEIFYNRRTSRKNVYFILVSGIGENLC